MELTPTLIRRETARRLRRVKSMTGEDIRRMRLDAHVSAAALSRAVGIDPAHLCRIEAGTANASVEVLVGLGVALGADLGVRYFAGAGPRIHDRFQAPILQAVLEVLSPRWRVELEVATPGTRRGVIDAVLRDRTMPVVVAVEVQSDLRRLEQQIRWAHEKSEALGAADTATRVSQLLVLRSTVRTRELARQYGTLLAAAFPARSDEAYAALTGADRPWPGAAVLWVNLHGRHASVMEWPPRGIRLGR